MEKVTTAGGIDTTNIQTIDTFDYRVNEAPPVQRPQPTAQPMQQQGQGGITLADILYTVRNIKANDRQKVYTEDLKMFINCISNIDKSQSQYYQDIWILGETDFKRKGFFVDFGAADGKHNNNTYLLETEYDWTGIVCEPNPIYHQRVKKFRNCTVVNECVFDETGKTVEFLEVDEPYLSTIKGFGDDDEHAEKREHYNSVEVQTISLFDMLEKYNAPNYIDYLSIDTEGSEFAILEAFFKNPNSKNYTIKHITVEQNFVPNAQDLVMRGLARTKEDVMTQAGKNIDRLLVSNGYVKKHESFSHTDGFYVKR